MKHTESLNLFANRHSAWLAQLDHSNLLLDMLDLLGSACIYLVDNQQQVLYWSLGMENLTGIKQGEITDSTYLPDYVIDGATSNSGQLIKLLPQQGKAIEVNKSMKILHDNKGAFHGWGIDYKYEARSKSEPAQNSRNIKRKLPRPFKPLPGNAGCFSAYPECCRNRSHRSGTG